MAFVLPDWIPREKILVEKCTKLETLLKIETFSFEHPRKKPTQRPQAGSASFCVQPTKQEK